MTYRIPGLSPSLFQSLFGRPDTELARRGALRVAVDQPASAPCRITLDDASPGETVLLLNYEHLAVDTPYRSRHAIYVREAAQQASVYEDEVPPALSRRLLSLRGFDASDMMIDADVVEGAVAEGLIRRLLDDPRTAYIHAHFARRGCFAARIERG